MLPLYKSNEKHRVTPIKWEDCKVGDVVFCKVRGSCVTHKVYAVDSEKGCLIGNNKGHMNGLCFMVLCMAISKLTIWL